jgi:hypothetical protein
MISGVTRIERRPCARRPFEFGVMQQAFATPQLEL